MHWEVVNEVSKLVLVGVKVGLAPPVKAAKELFCLLPIEQVAQNSDHAHLAIQFCEHRDP